jgi:hypothetical protein
VLTYDFRLPPGPRTVEYALLAKFGPSVLIPSYRHPMAQASAIRPPA